MKNSTRIKIGAGVIAAVDAGAVALGTTSAVMHVLEIKENKTYNVLKDGVRDATSLALIGSGTSGLVKLFKSRKLLKKTCELADAGSKTIEEVAAANENVPE